LSINSYAQNFEDVMLWRALGHITDGFYIDIGAQHPLIDSVSLAFHERDWRGIHVEPVPQYAEMLRQQRPGDTVIQAVVGDASGVTRFYEIPDTGISTVDATIAAQHRERGFEIHEITVPCIPLSAIFHACDQREIHWLKIDVEGFEQQVLASWCASAARPWIVVVESTLPLTQIEAHESWESMLIGYGYTAVYFDGLNRYYVSDVHPELKNAFHAPPNVFDGFSLNGTSSAPFHNLIEARYQKKISENLAQNEQLRSKEIEIERLTASRASLQATHAASDQNWAQREQVLSEQIGQTKQELEGLLCTMARQAEQVASQLLAVQQNADQEKAKQARQHREEERALHAMHAERELALFRELRAVQHELRELERNWNKKEQALNETIHILQREAQEIQHTQQLQAQLHDSERRAERGEYSRLTQALAEIQRALNETHASISWRMTLPLRKLLSLFRSQTTVKDSSYASAEYMAGPLAHGAAASVSQSFQTQQEFIGPIMRSSIPVTNSVAPSAAATLDELLAYDDREFVCCAYRTLLDREPDAEGMRYYLFRVRKGIAKLHILKQLRTSPECEGRVIDLPGLDRAIQRYQSGRIPLVGWMFRLINGTEEDRSIECKLRSIENQLLVLSDESFRRFNQIELALSELRNVVVQQTQASSQELTGKNFLRAGGLASAEPPSGLGALSRRAKNIYFQMKNSVAVDNTKGM
jgi:FkbM family methyltransferase